jgi:hypothetical protein
MFEILRNLFNKNKKENSVISDDIKDKNEKSTEDKIKKNISLLSDSNDFMIVFGNGKIISSENQDDTNNMCDFLSLCKQTIIYIKKEMINRLTQKVYEERLEEFDTDLFLSYKEIDYQMARADMLQAELDYYKAINDPNGKYKSPQLQHMWEHLCQLKEKMKIFDSE